jgi:hypothetical protein
MAQSLPVAAARTNYSTEQSPIVDILPAIPGLLFSPWLVTVLDLAFRKAD